jgi:HD superfamily phosphohydrolase
MKTIRDPIHGDIELGEAELEILDSPEMQRLRRVKQLSFCSLVYPGANHTRFEHSLGTMHLAGKIARRLRLDEEMTQKLRIAGLLHDVGHLPFSHSLEGVLGWGHEENAERLLRGELGKLIKGVGYNPTEIAGLIKGEGVGKIISSQVDADRMDYLLRDSHYTGVAYGAIDVDRIINVMGMEGGKLFFHQKGLIALEALLIGRNQMFAAVYFHHTVRIAEAMLQEAMRGLDVTLDEITNMGDDELKLFARGRSEAARELLDMLDRRRLYKVCFSTPKQLDIISMRKKVIKSLVLKPHQVLINNIRLPKKSMFSIPIKVDGILKNIDGVSTLAKNLEKEIRRLEGTEACVPPDLRDQVSRFFERV